MNTTHNNTPDPRPEGDIPRASVLRAAADGEAWALHILENEQPANDTESAQIAHEQALRERVSAVMAQQHARMTLHDSIADVLANEPLADANTAGPASAAPLTHPAHDDHSQPNPILARIGGIFAIAAVLALAATLVFQAARPTAGPPPDVTVVRQISGYVIPRHADTVTKPAPIDFQPVADAYDAESAITNDIGACPDWFNERAQRLRERGYNPAALAGCTVPGFDGDSIHLIFKPTPDANGPDVPISVFIKRLDDGQQLASDACFICVKSQQAGKPVVFWRDGQYIVFIHATSADAVRLARDALKAPAPLRSI